MMRQGPGLIGTAARSAVYAGVSGRVARRQQKRWAAEDAADYAQYEQQAEAPSATPDYTAELEKLASLRDQGVITAEDFEAKKKQILGI